MSAAGVSIDDTNVIIQLKRGWQNDIDYFD